MLLGASLTARLVWDSRFATVSAESGFLGLPSVLLVPEAAVLKALWGLIPLVFALEPFLALGFELCWGEFGLSLGLPDLWCGFPFCLPC